MDFLNYLESSKYNFNILNNDCFMVSGKKPKNPLIQQIYKINMTKTKNKIDKIFIINFILNSIKKLTNKKSPFKIKCNIFGMKNFNVNTLNLRSRDVEVDAGKKLESLGFKIDLNSPKYIFVVNIFVNTVLISKLNLREYNQNYYSELNSGDKSHINFNNINKDFQINRSQLKLREALINFKINAAEIKNALDLGASPGGFSKELSNHNIKVTAIDPADLNEKLKDDRNIKHLKIKANKFTTNKKFDLIVNDMNLHPIESADIMVNLSIFLKKNGPAIMTIKCPSKNVARYIKITKQILKKKFKKFEIQHLLHNRMEITVKMIKK